MGSCAVLVKSMAFNATIEINVTNTFRSNKVAVSRQFDENSPSVAPKEQRSDVKSKSQMQPDADERKEDASSTC